MKKALYIVFTAFVVFCAGCAKAPTSDTKQPEKPAPVLRDPFRPDHPTRQEWEAEKRGK